MAKKHSVDLTTGSVMKKLISFAFPLWLATLVQQLYHAADVIVVGNFAQHATESLAAVGSTASLTGLLLNFFIGVSIGASIRIANLYGAKDWGRMRRSMTTALISAFSAGVLALVIGLLISRPLLLLLGSPPTVIDEATVYMKIIFIGQPAVLIYNTCSGIMRAHGESKRPMFIIMSTGLVNVLLNLLLVIVFHLDAAGVALATISAQYLSAAVALVILFRPDGEYHLSLREFVFAREEFLSIVKVGVPAGVNGMLFSLSNNVVVSKVNALGPVSIAAVSAATSVSTVFYTIPTAFSSACVSFAGQNSGAKRYDRVNTLLWNAILIVEVLFFSANVILTLFPEFFIGLYTREMDVVLAGIPKLLITSWGYLIYSFAEIANACQRGLGLSMRPTMLNLIFICGIRVLWMLLVYPHMEQNLTSIYICFPLSWLGSAIAQLISYYCAINKRKKEATLENVA